MREIESQSFPGHIILPDKVYRLHFSNRITGGRAFDRMLADFIVGLENPIDPKDSITTYVGASRELFEDYPSFRLPIPFEWTLARFLSYHVMSDSLHQLSGPAGEVLISTELNRYLGELDINDTEVVGLLLLTLASWARVFPKAVVSLADIYVSTQVHISKIERSVNALKSMGYIEERSDSSFRVLPKVFDTAESVTRSMAAGTSSLKEPTGMPSIFLSHNAKDKFFVRELADRLSKLGVRVWIDEAEIKVGDSLTDKIGKAIEKTDFVGVVLSRNSINSQWVQKELQIALQEEFRKKKVIVLPLLLEPVELPPFLRDKFYADFTTPEKFKESFPKLLAALDIPQDEARPLVTEVRADAADFSISRAEHELSNFIDIKIEDLDVNRSYRADESSLLFNMCLRLSAKPSEDWTQIFNAERRFPRHTMWRTARIHEDSIVILCVPDEIERFHLKDLKEDVLNANTKYRQYLFEQAQIEIRETSREGTEANKLLDLRKRLDFN